MDTHQVLENYYIIHLRRFSKAYYYLINIALLMAYTEQISVYWGDFM